MALPCIGGHLRASVCLKLTGRSLLPRKLDDAHYNFTQVAQGSLVAPIAQDLRSSTILYVTVDQTLRPRFRNHAVLVRIPVACFPHRLHALISEDATSHR